jgi:hypothetical protein
MGAKVICDKAGLPQSPDYYTMFGTIPVSKSESIKVDGKVGHIGENPFTLRNLVYAILLRASYGNDLCIVCHGNRDRVGILTKGESWLHHYELNVLNRNDPSDHGVFGMEKTAYANLLDDLGKVRALQLNHIAIRACRVGQDRQFLKKFGYLFGANSVSAPTLKTAYLKPRYYGVTNPEHRKIFNTAFPKTFEVPVSTPATAKVILGAYQYSKTQFKAGVAADADSTLRQFYSDNFPGSPTPTKKQLDDSAEGFPMHGLCVQGETNRFYFPKDPRYVSHLTMVSNCRHAFL